MSTTDKTETKARLEARLAEERRLEEEAAAAAASETATDPDGPLNEGDVPELDDELAARRGKPAEPALTQQEADEAFAAEMERHGIAMLELFGPDAELFEPCPTCQSTGFAFKDRDKPPVRKRHPRTRRCLDCDGLGQLDTDSLAPGQDSLVCPTCTGQGYVYPPELSGVQLPSEAAAAAAAPQPPAAATAGVLDQWGRPPGHAHYGMHPVMVGA